jgi:SAM-dependent methyltransferase
MLSAVWYTFWAFAPIPNTNKATMQRPKINLLNHYRMLWFLNFNRFKGNNMQVMREYFAGVFLNEIEEFTSLQGKSFLDVGGARGEYCQLMHEWRDCDAVNLEPKRRDWLWSKSVYGLADHLPFPDNYFEVVICRGVLEHVPTPVQQDAVNEMLRVLKPDGLAYILIPPWYSPHAGHSLKPFHVFPFPVAKFLRQLFFRKKLPFHSFADAGLYPITFHHMVEMIDTAGFRPVATRDTHFRLHFMTRIPLLREILVPSAAFILTKSASAAP